MKGKSLVYSTFAFYWGKIGAGRESLSCVLSLNHEREILNVLASFSIIPISMLVSCSGGMYSTQSCGSGEKKKCDAEITLL